MKKTIIISESQLHLIEKLVKEEGPLLNNGSVKEYDDETQVGTAPSCIHDADGNIKPPKDICADEIGNVSSYQGYLGTPNPKRG